MKEVFMTLHELFDSSILTNTLEDAMTDMDATLTEIAPEGKTLENFTGGYLQQLKNSTQFVAYFGSDKGGKNRATVKLTIDDDEIDEYYMMLKVKIQDMKKNGAKTVKVMSLKERKLLRAQEAKDTPTSKARPERVGKNLFQ